MSKKYLHPEKNVEMDTTTVFSDGLEDENVMHVNFAQAILMSEEDVSGHDIPVGRAMKGSTRFERTPDGRWVAVVRTFQKGNAIPEAEPLTTTEHGRITQNSKRTRVVFEWPRGVPFSQVADQLDDEVYVMRNYLESAPKGEE